MLDEASHVQSEVFYVHRNDPTQSLFHKEKRVSRSVTHSDRKEWLPEKLESLRGLGIGYSNYVKCRLAPELSLHRERGRSFFLQ